jgi:hypothetical protein
MILFLFRSSVVKMTVRWGGSSDKKLHTILGQGKF